MNGQRETVSRPDAELMRGRRGILGRTLSHMLDPVFESQGRRLVSLEARLAETEARLAETEARLARSEARVTDSEAALKAERPRVEELILQYQQACDAKIAETTAQLRAETERRLSELAQRLTDEQEGRLAAVMASMCEAEQRRSSDQNERRASRETQRFDHLAAELLRVSRAQSLESVKSLWPECHVSSAVHEPLVELPPVSARPYDSPDHGRALQEVVVQRSYNFTHSPPVRAAAQYDGINLWHCLEAEVSRVLTLTLLDEIRLAGRVVKS